MNPRIFVGVFPAGISYADREREVAGDYKRLAFLPFTTLCLSVSDDCPPDLAKEIAADAATIQARGGQSYQVSTTGQTVLLGTPGRYAFRSSISKRGGIEESVETDHPTLELALAHIRQCRARQRVKSATVLRADCFGINAGKFFLHQIVQTD